MTRQEPYQGVSAIEIAQRVKDAQYEALPQLAADHPLHAVVALIASCWQLQPEARQTANDLYDALNDVKMNLTVGLEEDDDFYDEWDDPAEFDDMRSARVLTRVGLLTQRIGDDVGSSAPAVFSFGGSEA